MENQQNKSNIFGYEVSTSSNITDNFVHIENYGDITDGYVSKNSFGLKSPNIRKDGHKIKYRILVSAFLSKDNPDDMEEIGVPYAEVIFIPEYRSLNNHYKTKTMKIAENDIINLKSDVIYGKMWSEGIGMSLLQQTDGFMNYENEEDFKQKFYNAFAHIYHHITSDMDLYLDRAREHKSYWEELNEYCNESWKTNY